MACICFTTKFIGNIKDEINPKEDISKQDLNESVGNDKFMSLLYKKTFNARNLKFLEQDLEHIRKKQWLEDFPRGSALLTYLYRITLACEADLQVI